MVPQFMTKTSVVPKKRRGPAPTGKGIQVGERWHPSEIAAIDAWIASSTDKTLTRAHAIRRLVALGLRAKPERGQSNRAQKVRATEMAAGTIDKMADKSATADQQANRKQRLLKGPEEFRSGRTDRLAKK
jgi:hypothetical protein